jgi:hypothetical protein
LAAMMTFNGMRQIMTKKPAKMLGPSSFHKK